MAHESFEDLATADILNEHFVAIKIDREERPDVDAIYLEAVEEITGRGGWPLSVFATPEGKPFFGGTYFPKDAGPQHPNFIGVLNATIKAWNERRDNLDQQATELTATVSKRLAPAQSSANGHPNANELLQNALEKFREMFDDEYGGIGYAPKFARAPMLELLFAAHLLGHDGALEMALTTLENMASGGIYDQLGGGFSRYSVDREWLVPHFEKMLYDQALLGRVYLHAWQITRDDRWLQVVTETIDYVRRDLTDQSGAVRSAEDADSSGSEGLFYTWTHEEIITVLGKDAPLIFNWYGPIDQPNFDDGRSILYRVQRGDLLRSPEVEDARRRLFLARTKRIRPEIDDKILTEWNAMFCSTLCEAAAATGDTGWRQAAITIGQIILGPLRRDSGRFLRSMRSDVGAPLAMATDYAWIVDCLTRLSELTGESHYLDSAVEVADDLIDLFSAPGGGWFLTGSDGDQLVVRPSDTRDGVTPASGSVAASALARLGALSGLTRFVERSAETLSAMSGELSDSPISHAHLVGAAQFIEHGLMEIVVGPGRVDLISEIMQRYLPEAVLAWGQPTQSPLWEGRGDARAYVCRAGICQAPAITVNELVQQIDRAMIRL
jgi:hypothetical protein